MKIEMIEWASVGETSNEWVHCKWTNKQTDKSTDKRTKEQTNKQVNKWMNTWKNKQANKQYFVPHSLMKTENKMAQGDPEQRGSLLSNLSKKDHL